MCPSISRIAVRNRAPPMPTTVFSTRRMQYAMSAWALSAFAVVLLFYINGRNAPALNLLPSPWGVWVRGSGPSFVHTFTFALLACAWFARSWRETVSLGLLIWCVDVTIELLQMRSLHDLLGSTSWARALLVSTLDVNDLIATTLGVLAAWLCVAWAHHKQKGTTRA
jgi:hypothetical protein